MKANGGYGAELARAGVGWPGLPRSRTLSTPLRLTQAAGATLQTATLWPLGPMT